MSNNLVIRVMRFQSLNSNEVEYGYVASDDYAKCYNDGFETLADFYAAYPSEYELVNSLCSQPGFEDIIVTKDPEATYGVSLDTARLEIEGFNPQGPTSAIE